MTMTWIDGLTKQIIIGIPPSDWQLASDGTYYPSSVLVATGSTPTLIRGISGSYNINITPVSITFPITLNISETPGPAQKIFPIVINVNPPLGNFAPDNFIISSSLELVPISIPLFSALINDATTLLSGSIETFYDEDRVLKTLLNFGGDFQQLLTNWMYDPFDPSSSFNSGSSILVKLYEPLPNVIDPKTQVWISRELSPPVVDRLFTKFTPSPAPLIYLRPPDRDIKVNNRIGISSQNITLTKLFSSTSFNPIIPTDPVLEQWYTDDFNSSQLNVDYTDFSNFVFFGSAQARIDAFVQKLLALENFNSILLLNSGSFNGTGQLVITGSSLYPSLQKLGDDRINLLRSFDPFEQFLYYTTGSAYSSSFSKDNQDEVYVMSDITYPKSASVVVPVSSASDWYNNISVIASAYDTYNVSSLVNGTPVYLQNDISSKDYLTFLNLIGYQFDIIKLYIDQMTSMYDRNSDPIIGMSPDIIWDIAQSLGIDLPNQYAIETLVDYTIGGSELNPIIYRKVAAETWKRFLHNQIFLMKTKGTATSLRALANSYGLLPTTLRIRESEIPGTAFPTGTYEQYDEQTNTLNILPGAYLTVPWANQATVSASTIEIRFATTNTTSSTILMHGDTDWAMVLVPTTGSNGNITLFSGSVPIISSSELPLFTGDFVSTMMRLDSLVVDHTGSGAFIVADGLEFADGQFFADSVTSIASSSVVGSRIGLFIKQASTIGNPESLAINDISFEIGAIFTPEFNQVFADGQHTFDGTVLADGTFISSTNVAESSIASVFWQPNNLYIGTSGSYFGTGSMFSGLIDEVRVWGVPIDEQTFTDHTLNPGLYNGNAVDDPRNSLYLRLSFNKPQNLFISLTLNNESPYVRDINTHDPLYNSISASNFEDFSVFPYNMDIINRNVLRYSPNSGGGGIFSTNKIKILNSMSLDFISGSTIPVLSPNHSILSIEDKLEQSKNTNLVGFYFSLTDAINDSIIRSFGKLDLQDLIGDPADYYNNSYSELNLLNDLYWTNYSYTYDITRFINFVENLLDALFTQARQLVPIRTKLLTGIVHEPHILERNKIAHSAPEISAGKFTRINNETYNLDATVNNDIPDNVSGDYLVTDAELSIQSSYELISELDNIDGTLDISLQENIVGEIDNYSATIDNTDNIIISTTYNTFDDYSNYLAYKSLLLQQFNVSSELQLSAAQLAHYTQLISIFQSPSTVNVNQVSSDAKASMSASADDFIFDTIEPLTDFNKIEDYTYFSNLHGLVETIQTQYQLINNNILRDRGIWQSGIQYSVNDKVYQMGISGSVSTGDNIEYICISPDKTFVSFVKPYVDTRNWTPATYIPVNTLQLKKAFVISGSVSLVPTSSTGFPLAFGYLPNHYRFTHNRARGILNHQYLGCLQTQNTTTDGQPPVVSTLSTDSGGRLVVRPSGTPIITQTDNSGPILTVQ